MTKGNTGGTKYIAESIFRHISFVLGREGLVEDIMLVINTVSDVKFMRKKLAARGLEFNTKDTTGVGRGRFGVDAKYPEVGGRLVGEKILCRTLIKQVKFSSRVDGEGMT